MVNRNDEQAGMGGFLGGNGSQLRHAQFTYGPLFLCDLTASSELTRKSTAYSVGSRSSDRVFGES